MKSTEFTWPFVNRDVKQALSHCPENPASSVAGKNKKGALGYWVAGAALGAGTYFALNAQSIHDDFRETAQTEADIAKSLSRSNRSARIADGSFALAGTAFLTQLIVNRIRTKKASKP